MKQLDFALNNKNELLVLNRNLSEDDVKELLINMDEGEIHLTSAGFEYLKEEFAISRIVELALEMIDQGTYLKYQNVRKLNNWINYLGLSEDLYQIYLKRESEILENAERQSYFK